MTEPRFPADENGRVLKRMYQGGDDLTKARMIDFCFVFPRREEAIEFILSVDDRDLESCLSYYEEQESWQVIVKRHMIPEHAAITDTEQALSDKAELCGGRADGWGCFRIPTEH